MEKLTKTFTKPEIQTLEQYETGFMSSLFILSEANLYPVTSPFARYLTIK